MKQELIMFTNRVLQRQYMHEIWKNKEVSKEAFCLGLGNFEITDMQPEKYSQTNICLLLGQGISHSEPERCSLIPGHE